jgi:hypothetical protein
MRRIVYVDIDGVLACNNPPVLIEMCNRLLKLEIPEEQLAMVGTRKAFDALPQAQAYQERTGKDIYQRQMARMEWHPLYVFRCNVMEGAPQGVAYLARRVDELGYLTARYINFNEGWNEHLARVTRIWLKNNDFYGKVAFSDGVKAKLETIASKIRKERCQTWLVDDSLDNLLAAFNELSAEDQGLLRDYLTLVAFGYDECEGEYPIPVIPFPNWREVSNLLVEKEFNYGDRRSTEQSSWV